jgi:two-component system chemotaxis response regulator CheB
MLCDDSGTMRRLIRKSIENDPGIKVVAEARNGKDCIGQLPTAKPEVIILDVEMPIMDGIDTVKAVRKINKHLPIIMFSSLTSQGAEATFDAIQAGANSFATKPVSIGHIENAIKEVQDNLVPLIVSFTRSKPRSKPTQRSSIFAASNRKPIRDTAAGAIRKTAETESLKLPKKTDVVAIGVSTGGPDALERVLQDIPKAFPIPILITQHMPAVFTTMLAQRLSQKTGHNVVEARNGQPLGSKEILIAPGDYHLQLERKGTSVTTLLTQEPPENSCRPAVDPMFRSVAKLYGQRTLGVVLTGMGKDGTEGARALKASGAVVYVQDEATSVVWGMPGKVHDAGLADRVLPIDEMGHAISRCCRRALLPSGSETTSKVGSK